MKTTETNKLVHGKGMNDIDEPVTINGKVLKFYNVWTDMLQRCYSKKYQDKHPTYRGCSVCDEWLLLSNFKIWFDANYRDGLALDKDVLVKGNRVYCPEACSFVPGYINTLLTDNSANRGDYPLGVVAIDSGKRYKAQCCNGRREHMTKNFRTVAEAAAWYSIEKKKVAKKQAIRAFAAGDITEGVYQALITREW